MPLPLALMGAMMIPGLIPGLGAGIAGVGKGIGSAASGVGKGIGSAYSGLGEGIGAGASGVGKGVGGLAEKGLGAVGDFLFGDDEEDTNYDTMTIDNLEIDTLEIDTANIDKLVIDSKDLGKTDDNKTDNEKLDAKEQQETQDNLFSGLSEDSDTVPESLSAEGTSALPESLSDESLSAEGTSLPESLSDEGTSLPLPESLSAEGTSLPESLSDEGTSLPESLSAEGTLNSTTNIFNNEETIEPPKANNNKEDKFLPNVETLTESSEGMTNILGGGESSGGSFADLTMDASEMTSELGSISETLATPEEGPGFNWEDIKDAIGGGGGGGVMAGLWEGVKDTAGGLWEAAGDFFGFDTASDVEAKAKAEAEAKGKGNISNETLSSIDTTTQSILANIESAYGMTEPIEEKATWNDDDKNKDSQWEIPGAISYKFSDEQAPTNDAKEGTRKKNKGQIHSTDGSTPSRGMTPAYTKAPPARPPSTSSIIIQEIRSYNQYPPWMWKVG